MGKNAKFRYNNTGLGIRVIMALEVNPNQSLDYAQQMNELKLRTRKETIVKSLLATSALIAGIAAIVLLHGHLLATAIGIIVISTIAIYQYYNCYSHSKNVFTRAANAITQNLAH